MNARRIVIAVCMLAGLLPLLPGRAHGQFPWQRPVPRNPAEVRRILGPIAQREPSRELTIVWVSTSSTPRALTNTPG